MKLKLNQIKKLTVSNFSLLPFTMGVRGGAVG
jgi:hypothetical protein